METVAASRLLTLPQELRDLIYCLVLDEELAWPEHFQDFVDDKSRPPVMSTWALEIEQAHFRSLYPSSPHRPAWYSLLLCCKSTKSDVTQLLATRPDSSALIDMAMTSSTATAHLKSLPNHPSKVKDLHINIRLSHLWDPDVLSTAPQKDNKILRSIFNLLRRYIKHGPHLSRSSPLSSPLALRNIILSVNPAFDAEEASYFFGNPTQQLGTVCGVLMTWLARFVKSGLLWGSVERFKWTNEWVQGEVVELQYEITSEIWDESDFVVFKELGYTWCD